MQSMPINFTFHYASTYTEKAAQKLPEDISLHSTMLLLIHRLHHPSSSAGVPLHSTMLLLILCRRQNGSGKILALHSTMLLLILGAAFRIFFFIFLYIPLCFYLYIFQNCPHRYRCCFTFHYASTYTRTISGAIFTILFSYKLSTPFC